MVGYMIRVGEDEICHHVSVVQVVVVFTRPLSLALVLVSSLCPEPFSLDLFLFSLALAYQ